MTHIYLHGVCKMLSQGHAVGDLRAGGVRRVRWQRGGEFVGAADTGDETVSIDTSPPAEDTGSAPVEDATPETAPPPWTPDLVDLAMPCTDTAEQVYLAPVGPTSDAARGDVVRCTVDGTWTVADVQAKIGGKDDTSKASALKIVRIAYRTRRGDGRPAIGTARVYLPSTPRPGPLPVVVSAHPSEGLADGCAPSRDEGKMNEVATPLGARGYAVIAPDFAGLGNEGTQGYLDNHDTGYSTLDAARALRKLLKPGAFSAKVAMNGYSQGGGAVLSAQALARTYGVDGELVAVAAFAPQWPTRLNSFGFVDLLKQPDALTISFGITKPVVAVLRTYAHFANATGDHGAGIPAATRSSISNSIDNLCLVAFGGALQGSALRVRDFFDDGLRTGLLACVADPKAAGVQRFCEGLPRVPRPEPPQGGPEGRARALRARRRRHDHAARAGGRVQRRQAARGRRRAPDLCRRRGAALEHRR